MRRDICHICDKPLSESFDSYTFDLYLDIIVCKECDKISKLEMYFIVDIKDFAKILLGGLYESKSKVL